MPPKRQAAPKRPAPEAAAAAPLCEPDARESAGDGERLSEPDARETEGERLSEPDARETEGERDGEHRQKLSRAQLAQRTESVVMTAAAANDDDLEHTPRPGEDNETPFHSAPPATPATPAPTQPVTRQQLQDQTHSVRKMLLQPGDHAAHAAPMDRGELMQRSDSVSKMFADPSRGQKGGTIVVEFAEEGPLGLVLTGDAEHGPLPTIQSIAAGSAAASRVELRKGLVLLKVQGQAVGGNGKAGLGFHDALEAMRTSARPLTLVFAPPEAVPTQQQPASLAGLLKWTSDLLPVGSKRPQPFALDAMDSQELRQHQRALAHKLTEWAGDAAGRRVALAAHPQQLIQFAEERNLYHLQPEEIHSDFVQEGAVIGSGVLSSLTVAMEATARDLRSRQATAVDVSNDEHWALLCELWKSADHQGEPPREENADESEDEVDDPVAAMLRVSSRPKSTPTKSRRRSEDDGRRNGSWTRLGFQNEEPATDFRAGGLLSLQCMVYLAQRYHSEFREMLGLPARHEEPEPEPEPELEPGVGRDLGAEAPKAAALERPSPPSLACVDERSRLPVALTVIHLVNLLGKLLGLECFGEDTVASASKAPFPNRLLANALRPQPEGEEQRQGDEKSWRGFEELVCAGVLRFGRLWVSARAEFAQFDALLEVTSHGMRQLLLGMASGNDVVAMQRWACERPPASIPPLSTLLPPSLSEDAIRRVGGIRLKIPPGSGAVGVRIKPVDHNLMNNGAVALEVAEIVENTVGAASRLRLGCSLYAVQSQLVDSWPSAERFARALSLINELLSSNQQTELIFTPPSEKQTVPVAAAGGTLNWRESLGELSRLASAKTEELVESLQREIEKDRQRREAEELVDSHSAGLGLPPKSTAPIPATKETESQLLRQMPEVMVEFRDEGPIGINFESRGRDTRGPLTIVGCVAGGPAAREPDLLPNSVVLAVNGASVIGKSLSDSVAVSDSDAVSACPGLPFQQALAMIKAAPRPLVLAVRHPPPDPALSRAFEALAPTP